MKKKYDFLRLKKTCGFRILKLHFPWPSWKVNENIKFLRDKEVQESKHSSVTARESLTQFAKYLGHMGPPKCNNGVFWVPLKTVKGKGRNHRTSRKAARIISCYLKARGKETFRAWNQSEKAISQPWNKDRIPNSHKLSTPEYTSCPSFLILLSSLLPLPFSVTKAKYSSQAVEMAQWSKGICHQ